jgi:hypothetical protein
LRLGLLQALRRCSKSSGVLKTKKTKTTIEDCVVDDWMSLQKMQMLSWVYLVVLTIGSWLGFQFFKPEDSWSFACAVFIGGIISIVSFIVSHKDVIGFIDSLTPAQNGESDKKSIKKNKLGFLLKFWLRIFVIGIVLVLLIKSVKINIFGLILGLSTVVFTVTFTALSVARHYFFSGRR